MKLTDFKNKKIIILGMGREGIDNFLFLKKSFPDKVIGIGDRKHYEELDSNAKKCIEKYNGARLHLGKQYLAALKKYDVILKSPGIPYRIISPHISKNQLVASQTEIFFDNCRGRIIGVTGTKGKSTTSSLIYAVLKAGGVKAHLIGNIEKPVLSYLSNSTDKDVFVYELSSHQLQNLKQSPHIAVFLNIYPEHLDYYDNFRDYLAAKRNIALYQQKQDYLIYNSSEKFVAETAKKSTAIKISFAFKKAQCSVKNGYITYNKKRIFKIKYNPFVAEFYLLDIMPAIIIGKLFGITDKKIQEAVRQFKPLKNRLELVGTYKGITFYNDALATIPEATIAAIDSLGKGVQTMLLGGYDRNINYKKLAEKILDNKIENVILFPTTGELIWNEIKKQSIKFNGFLPKNFPADTMREAVRLAYLNTRRDRICLLSCASASFSIFKDYKEKGDSFKKFVKKFAKLN